MIERIGRNDPCPCGSGVKFKKCCAEKLAPGMPDAQWIDTRAMQGLSRGPEIRDPTKPGIVVKVQVPLDGNPFALVYDRDRTFKALLPVTDELRAQVTGPRGKGYFYATVLAGDVKLLEPAPWQEW